MNKLFQRLLFLVLWLSILLGGVANALEKPTGVFSSSGGSGSAIFAHVSLRGVLVRAVWSSIEPRPGVYDFTGLDAEIDNIEGEGKQWSLAIVGGGIGSPDWLIDDLEVPYVSYSFRGEPGYRLPLYWDVVVQARLAHLANAMADAYADREALQLVYVTQMTSNGIEGHLQGVDMSTLVAAGYTDVKWVDAAKAAARSFAAAFMGKAIAIEVHEVNGGAEVPSRIINELWLEPGLEQRVGAAMWWLSGKNSYLPDLIDVLTAYPGDIYAQLISNSSDPSRFGDGDIATAFEQAKAIGVRYIEAWEYEFKTSMLSANGALDTAMVDFNQWADEHAASSSPSIGRLGPPRGAVAGDDFELSWLPIQGQTYRIHRSFDLVDWEPLMEHSALASDWVSVLDLDVLGVVGQARAFYRVE